MKTLLASLLFASGLYLLSIVGLFWHWHSYGPRADAAVVPAWYFGAGLVATGIYGACAFALAVAYRLASGSKQGTPTFWLTGNARPQFSLGALVVVTVLLPPILYYVFQILSSISYITRN